MVETFTVEILSPARSVVSTEAEMAIVPGSEGQFTALPRHAPMLSSLGMDVLTIVSNGKRTDYFVAGGIVDVRPEGIVVLADEAIAVSEISLQAVNERMEAAEETLRAAASTSQRENAQRTIAKLEAMKALAAA